MRPRGASARTRSTDTSWRAIWQKTFCSRTRRAMSWPYCEPKSKISTRSLSGNGVMLVHGLGGWGCGIHILAEQFLQHGTILNGPVAHEALHVDVPVLQEIDLP